MTQFLDSGLNLQYSVYRSLTISRLFGMHNGRSQHITPLPQVIPKQLSIRSLVKNMYNTFTSTFNNLQITLRRGPLHSTISRTRILVYLPILHALLNSSHLSPHRSLSAVVSRFTFLLYIYNFFITFFSFIFVPPVKHREWTGSRASSWFPF